MKKILICTFVSLICSTSLTHAEDDTLSAKIKFGYDTKRGNTNTTKIKTDLNVKKDTKRWEHDFVLNTSQEETDSSDKIEKYLTSLQSDYKYSKENASIYVFGSFKSDKAGGFDSQTTISAGYSDYLLKNDISEFKYSVGPGFSYDVNTDNIKSENFVARLSLDYSYKISPTSEFSQKVSSDYVFDSEENTKSNSITSLTTKINGSLALSISYIIEYNSAPPGETLHMDRTSNVSLDYTIF